MKQQTRKPLILALALGASLAMPLAFAQNAGVGVGVGAGVKVDTPAASVHAGTHADVAAQAATPATPAVPATPATTTTSADGTTTVTAATPAVPATPATPARKSWSALDLDKNGSLSKAEAESVNSLSKVFVEADANADGQLTADEYKAYLATSGKGAARSGREG